MEKKFKLPRCGEEIIIIHGQQLCLYGGIDVETKCPFARPKIRGGISQGIFFTQWKYPNTETWFNALPEPKESRNDSSAGTVAGNSPAA
jgi:hypothetical protein